MATEKHTAETIVQYLTEVADARLRSMMGEYLVYVDDIVIGQINEGELFIKTTPFGEQFTPSCTNVRHILARNQHSWCQSRGLQTPSG